MRVIIQYWPEATDDADMLASDPEFSETVRSLDEATAAVGRLERYVGRHTAKPNEGDF